MSFSPSFSFPSSSLSSHLRLSAARMLSLSQLYSLSRRLPGNILSCVRTQLLDYVFDLVSRSPVLSRVSRNKEQKEENEREEKNGSIRRYMRYVKERNCSEREAWKTYVLLHGKVPFELDPVVPFLVGNLHFVLCYAWHVKLTNEKKQDVIRRITEKECNNSLMEIDEESGMKMMSIDEMKKDSMTRLNVALTSRMKEDKAARLHIDTSDMLHGINEEALLLLEEKLKENNLLTFVTFCCKVGNEYQDVCANIFKSIEFWSFLNNGSILDVKKAKSLFQKSGFRVAGKLIYGLRLLTLADLVNDGEWERLRVCAWMWEKMIALITCGKQE